MFTHAPTVGDAPMPLPLPMPMTTAAKKDAKIMKILSQVHSQRRTWRWQAEAEAEPLAVAATVATAVAGQLQAAIKTCNCPFRSVPLHRLAMAERERETEREGTEDAVRGFVRQVNTRSPNPKRAKTETKSKMQQPQPQPQPQSMQGLPA